MSRSVRIVQRAVKQAGTPVADIPAFLCPGILRIASRQATRCDHQPRPVFRASQRRYTASMATGELTKQPKLITPAALDKLPQQCAGCGAFSQLVDPEGPGFYTLTRGSVKTFLKGSATQMVSVEDEIVKKALEQAGTAAQGLGLDAFSTPAKNIELPVCDRCHKLKHHETGVSIHHPSVQSIQDTIFESPYKYNHVYHVLDAADFPMSLVQGLHKLLHLTPQRSRNRRSKNGKFYHGRKTEVSFIITRSDLLAPLKSQVDSMMPYLRAVLRDALWRTGKDARLGNLRCVSAKRDWWTKELKEEIWHRGGGGWMVGKVNVGKSQLFHSVFPKGRRELDKPRWKKDLDTAAVILKDLKNGQKVEEVAENGLDGEVEANTIAEPGNEEGVTASTGAAPNEQEAPDAEYEGRDPNSLDTSTLLPPAPPEEDYPAMPLISSLPGTTASPIRLSFGNGKGELIDLPGLSRGDLELHVKPEFRNDLVMRSQVRPEQQVVKPGQSILLGGFIRITPTTDMIITAYAFTPIKPHLTRTDKAIGIQTGVRDSGVENIALPEMREKIASAGIFHLKWDVTRQRAGPLTDPSAAGINARNLPFRILSTDILIEGCGWVELVAQVRRSPSDISPFALEEDPERTNENEGFDFEQVGEEIDPSWPAVEVFTPEGKFVGARRPMNAWLNVAKKPAGGKLQGRPRKSMKGAKKVEKKRKLPAPL